MASESLNSSGLTPEQIQLALRLESIFMPHARKQRDEAYKRQEGSPEPTEAKVRFAHYTSAEAALSIIKSKRVWMRNTTCMSDYREVQHGFEILNKFFADQPKRTRFIQALDSCVPRAAQEAIDLFNQHLGAIRLNTYIGSVSEHDSKEDFHGRLSMWRAFGGSTTRVAIIIKVPGYSGAALALNLIFSPVAYWTEEEGDAALQNVIENIRADCEFLQSIDRQIIVNIVFDMLLAGVTCLKHEGFREEREWRAIYYPKLRPSPLMESSAEIVNGVPQIVFKVPLDATASPALASLDFAGIFDRLIIGPSPYPWVMYEAFAEALSQAGIADAGKRVWASNIPIRS